MKKTITIILFFAFAIGIQAQSFEYIIPPYGPLFTLDILEISENEKDTTITRKGQLDTASVQAVMYGNVRQSYNRIARLEASILESVRLRNAYLSALNEAGLNDYFATEISRTASEFNGNWVVVIDGAVYRCDVEGDTRVLRIAANDVSGEVENTAVAGIVPRSRIYILLNPQSAFETVTDENVELFSSDGRNYYGNDSTGKVYRLRKL